jgi:hypothetical protein
MIAANSRRRARKLRVKTALVQVVQMNSTRPLPQAEAADVEKARRQMGDTL